jgi:hypothetical protein
MRRQRQPSKRPDVRAGKASSYFGIAAIDTGYVAPGPVIAADMIVALIAGVKRTMMMMMMMMMSVVARR